MIEKPILLPKSPYRGGINVLPTYAKAIWIEIIAPEDASPKLPGVE